MPLENLGGGCWRWGSQGKKYCGGLKGKKAALRQGFAEDPKHFKEEVSKSEELQKDIEELITAGEIDRYDYYAESSLNDNNEEDFAVSYVSQKERDKMPDSEFGDPKNKRFPVKDEKHFRAAVKLLGRIPKSEQGPIKERLKKIALKHGWKLPSTWA